jgi:radical SAM protein with 4Fe4S-binding SPASM domain
MGQIKVDKRGAINNLHDVRLLIEMSDRCNNRCIMCKHSWSEKMHADMPTSFMDPGLFIKIINELKHSRIDFTSIDPLWAGESLMNPSFKEMISYMFIAIRRFGICRATVINTNAFFMDKEVVDIFLNHGKFVQEHADEGYYFRLYFSLDAATSETYAKIRNVPQVTMDKVLTNIDYFMRRRKEMNLIIPNAIFIFIVMEENKHEARAFMQHWKQYLDKLGVTFDILPTWPLDTKKDAIYFRQLICPDMNKAIKLHRDTCIRIRLWSAQPKHKAISRQKEKAPILATQARRRPCAALWRTPNIQANGIVVPCCRDINLSLNLGNIRDKSIDEIWFGDKIREMRRAHIDGDLSKYPVCENCLEPEGEISEEDLVNLSTL